MTGISPRTLQALRQGNALEASDALAAVVAAGSAADDAVTIAVHERIHRGDYLRDDPLTDWLVAAAPASTQVFNMVGCAGVINWLKALTDDKI